MSLWNKTLPNLLGARKKTKREKCYKCHLLVLYVSVTRFQSVITNTAPLKSFYVCNVLSLHFYVCKLLSLHFYNHFTRAMYYHCTSIVILRVQCIIPALLKSFYVCKQLSLHFYSHFMCAMYYHCTSIVILCVQCNIIALL